MKLSEAICETLKDIGFKYSVGMVGVQSLQFYNSIKQNNIESILITSEQNVNYMACGNYLSSGKLNMFVNIVSPGLMHSTEGIYYALKNRIPLFVIVTTYDETITFKNQLHEIDNTGMIDPICKTYKFAGLQTLVNAFCYAMNEKYPVVIEIPCNMYNQNVEYCADLSSLINVNYNYETSTNLITNNISVSIGSHISGNGIQCNLDKDKLKMECMELVTANSLNIKPRIISNIDECDKSLYSTIFSHDIEICDNLLFAEDNQLINNTVTNAHDYVEILENALRENNIYDVYVEKDNDIVLKNINIIKPFNNVSLFFSSYGYNCLSSANNKLSCVLLTNLDNAIPPSGLAEAYQDNVPMIILVPNVNDMKINMSVISRGHYSLQHIGDAKNVALKYRCPVIVSYADNCDICINNNNTTIPSEICNDTNIPSEIYNDIAKSKCPLLYLGNINVKQEKILDLANKLDCFVATTFSAKGLYPENDKRWLWCGLSNASPTQLHDIMNEIDLVIMIGCKMSEVVTGHYRHYCIDTTKTYHININGEDIYHMATPIIMDGNKFIDNMLCETTQQQKQLPYEQLENALHEISAESNYNSDRTTPHNILNKIKESVVICESGNSMLHCVEQLRLTKPNNFFGPFDFSCMGTAIPAAAGMASYDKSIKITCVVGDGAFRMSFSEIYTIAKNNMNVSIVIFNDGELNMMSTIQNIAYGSKYQTTLQNIDIHSICKLFDINYYEYDNNDDIDKYQRPCVINCMVDYSKSPFFLDGILLSKQLVKKEKNTFDVFSILEDKKDKDDISIIDDHFNVKLSYKELYSQVCKLCTYYKNIGVTEQSVIAVMNNNSYHNMTFHYCIAGLNCILLNINTRLTETEINYIFKNSNVKYLIASIDFKEKINYDFENVLFIENDYDDIIKNSNMCNIVRNKDVSEFNYQLYYTSGTTGNPKGVMLTHKNIYSHMTYAIDEFAFNKDDIWGHISPMYHLVDIFSIYSVTKQNGKHMFLNKFDMNNLLNILTKITVSNIASSLCQILLNYLDESDDKYDFNLRLFSCGGSSLSNAYIQKAINAFKCKFFVSYGMTECCGKISMSLVGDIHKKSTSDDIKFINTSGRKFKGIELKVVSDDYQRIVDKTNKDIGEVLLKGDTLFNGYLGYDNSSYFTDDGWFKTGDLAVMNEHEYITIIDRKKDMILSGSENVYTIEVENVISGHEKIKQCCVFESYHEILGSTVSIAVILNNLEHVITVNELNKFCNAKLASFKIPQQIYMVKELPLTGSGKIAKHKLTNMAYNVEWTNVSADSIRDTNFDFAIIQDNNVITDIKHEYIGDISDYVYLEKMFELLQKLTKNKINLKVIARQQYYYSISSLLRVIENENDSFSYTLWCIDDHHTTINYVNLNMNKSFSSNEIFVNSDSSGNIVIKKPQLHSKQLINTRATSYENKNFIITGGTGGIGISLTKWLVEEKKAGKVIVLSRSNKESSINDHIINFKCDITNINDVVHLKTYLENNKIDVNGIFHLAGVLGDSFFGETSFADFKSVIDPKVRGTSNIVNTFGSVDFIILFSSIFSIFSYSKLCHYNFANGYLNDIAERHSNVKSIHWPTWGTSGMASNLGDGFKTYWENQGMNFIGHDDGMNALDNAINNDYNNIGMYKINWEEYNENTVIKPFVIIEQMQPKNIQFDINNTATTTINNTANDKHMTTVDSELFELMSDITGVSISEISGNYTNADNFSDFGIDSVIMPQFRSQLNKKFKINISLMSMFTKLNTISKLSEYINQHTDYHVNPSSEHCQPEIDSVCQPKIDSVCQPENLVNNDVLIKIQHMINETLGTAQSYPLDSTLNEIGVDSIKINIFRRLLNNEFKSNISLMSLFTKLNTIEKISDSIICTIKPSEKKPTVSVLSNETNIILPGAISGNSKPLCKNNINIGASFVFGNNIKIGKNVSIGNNVIIGDGVTLDNVIIGNDVIIKNGCTIKNANIGHNTEIWDYTIINGYDLNTHDENDMYVIIGNNNIIMSGAIISGQVEINTHNKIYHQTIIGGEPNIVDNEECGGIKIGSHNTIKEKVVVHGGSSILRQTIIGNNCFIHTSVHIGHDVVVGDRVILCVGVILAGFVTVMHHANLGIGSMIMQCCTVGPYCMINAGIFVIHNVLPFTVYTNRLGNTNCSSHINVIGLSRGGITDQEIDEIEAFYTNNKKSLSVNNTGKWFSEDLNNFRVVINNRRKIALSTFFNN